MLRLLRLGFVVNPLAGVGGPAGLKGSDDVPKDMLAQLPRRASVRSAAGANCCRTLINCTSLPALLLWGITKTPVGAL